MGKSTKQKIVVGTTVVGKSLKKGLNPPKEIESIKSSRRSVQKAVQYSLDFITKVQHNLKS